MPDDYLSLVELGKMVLAETGVQVDTGALATEPATADELGVDSLGWLGVITRLENRFGIVLEEGVAESVTSLPDLVCLVNNRLGYGTTPGHTDNRVVIDAPLDLVWDLTNDVESWPQLFSEYSEATILERSGPTVRFRLSTRPDESNQVYSWVSERTVDPVTRTVRAHRVEKGVFEFMDIAWSYRQVDGGVEMRWVQDFAVRPDAPVDNVQMTAYVNRNSILQMARIAGLVEAAARAGVAAGQR